MDHWNNLVSVVLPVYNGERYILQLLNSLKSQEYRPVEIIIVDDFSTDRTLKIIKNWADKNESEISTKVIENSINLGLSGNFSRAYPYIRGDYIFIADQDDIWEKNKIKEQVEYLERNPDCIMCICDRSIIDDKGRLLHPSESAYLNRKKKKMTMKQVVCEPSIYAANCMAIRNTHMEDLFMIPKEIIEHDTYITVLASHYGNIGFLQKPLIKYRIHSNNLSGSFTIETTSNLIRCFRSRMKVNDKINRVKANDGPRIAEMLKKNYNINLYKFNNKLVNGKLNPVLFTALKDIYKAIMDGKINYFNKKR